MAKLYDIVNKVINADSMIEAEQILYGKDGIVINSSEYYKNIISSFSKKKETLIRKKIGDSGKTLLVFDLNDCNDLWNILFIYNYYIRYLEQKIDLINQDIKEQNIKKNILVEELKKININDELYEVERNKLNTLTLNLNKLNELKNKYVNYKNESLKKYVVQLENAQNIDEDELKEYLDKLKEAINCIQKMRDSFEHANENLNIDNVVSIDNPKNKFEISIPIKYLDGFNKGRIIADEDDMILVQQTNNISSPLLKALDFDVKKVDSFFYNIEPNYLEFILEQINYDINELYKLSINVFEHKHATKFFLQNNLDIFFISKLSDIAFWDPENTIDLLNNNIDISKLPNFYFKGTHDIKQCYKNAIKLLNFIKTSNINIEIYELPVEAFQYVDSAIMLLNENIDISKLSVRSFNKPKETIELIKVIKSLNIDISKLSEFSFYKPKETIELIKVIKSLNKNIDISKLPINAFRFYKNTIKLLNKNIDISRLPDYAFYEYDNVIKLLDANIDIYKLPEYAFYKYDNVIKLLDANIDIYKLPGSAFCDYNVTIKLLNMIKTSNKNVDISKLPNYVFDFFENSIKLLNENIDILKLPDYAIQYYESTIRLLKADIDIYKIIELVGKMEKIYKNLSGISDNYYKKLIELLIKNIDISKLPDIVLGHLDETIKLVNANIDVFNLPETAFYYPDSSIKLLQANIDISKLSYEAFKYPDAVIKLFNENINIYKLPGSAFEYYENTIKFLEANIDIYKLPEKAFSNYNNTIRLLYVGIDITKLTKDFFFESGMDILNLKRILEKVDYDQLNTLPIEIFKCDFCILDDMLLKYSSNISKSIFGIRNPKIIATLVYANSVLSNYNKNISTIDMDIQPYSIIGDTYIDNFNYKNNIDENIGREYNYSEFLEQFKLLDENDFDRSSDEVRKTFLTKIRNACAHFRFKPVKDNNGNILDDKIYIYDEDNKGINNFNLIIDLNDLIEIIREVEENIEMLNNQENQINRKGR